MTDSMPAATVVSHISDELSKWRSRLPFSRPFAALKGSKRRQAAAHSERQESVDFMSVVSHHWIDRRRQHLRSVI